ASRPRRRPCRRSSTCRGRPSVATWLRARRSRARSSSDPRASRTTTRTPTCPTARRRHPRPRRPRRRPARRRRRRDPHPPRRATPPPPRAPPARRPRPPRPGPPRGAPPRPPHGSPMEESYVGEILVRRGALDAEKLTDALATAEERGVDLRTLLVATRMVEESKLVRALADEVGMPFLEKLTVDRVPETLVEAVPINFARQHQGLPLGESDGVVHAAIGAPLDSFALDDLRALLGKPVDAVAAPGEAIDDAINRLYERKDETALAHTAEG